MKNQGSKPVVKIDSVATFNAAYHQFNSDQSRIDRLLELCESLERLVQNTKTDVNNAEEWANDLYLRCTWAEQEAQETVLKMQQDYSNLMDAFERLRSRSESEAILSHEEVQNWAAKFSESEEKRKLEKEQYLQMQRAFENQQQISNIKFDNFRNRVLELRNAQKAFFDKKRKIGSAPQELAVSAKLEKDMDDFLKFKQNKLYE